MINTNFQSIRDLIKAFPDEQTCVDHLEKLRWNGEVVSPFDATSKVYKCAGNKYKCKNTGKYFNVRTATLFDNTKVELQTWFLAIYLVTTHKKGISSLQLGRDLNVTQKTAWFMLQRIRNCFGIADNEGTDGKIGGGGQVVEVDESYTGGKVANFHKSKRAKVGKGELDAMANKGVVMGFVEREGRLRFQVVEGRGKIKQAVLETVCTSAELLTDTSGVYKGMEKVYPSHQVIDHAGGEYVRGKVHTNTIEGAFSLLDRGIIGIYHFVSVKHLQKYVDEFAFRYNTRKENECSRFNLLLRNCDQRLTYQTLIAK